MKNFIKIILNYLQEKDIDLKVNKKLNKIWKNIPKEHKIDKKVIISFITKWRVLDKKIDHRFLQMYASISGIVSENYVPECIYYKKIEPKLNNRIYTQAYADKNFYEKYFKDYNIFPKVILRKINKTYYDDRYNFISRNYEINNYLANFNEILLKPASETGGGRGVQVFRKDEHSNFVNKENHILNFDYLDKNYSNNLVIQEYIYQNPFFDKFNKSSLNTIRLFTYRSIKIDEVIPLTAVLRVGKEGMVTDNQASGGISVGLDEAGKLNNFAIDKYGKKYNKINNLDLSQDFYIDKYQSVKNLAIKIAKEMYYTRILGFDFCIDNNSNVRLLEINCKNIEINFLQMNNGPLFRSYTDEVIQYCLSVPKTINFDFYV